MHLKTITKGSFNRFDPQGNATQIMKRTYPEFKEESLSFINMLKSGNIDESIIRLTSNLSLLPADSSLANLSDIISKQTF